MNYVTASISESGPRPVNEDAWGVWHLQSEVAVVVADGLGGMGGGRIASTTAVEAFAQFVQNSQTEISERALHTLALRIHAKIQERQRVSRELSTMATTFTAGIFLRDILRAVHCGDSRIAVVRGDRVRRLTTDHSEAQRLLDAGKLTRDEYLNYPRKNILESALGIQGDPRVDDVTFEVRTGDKIFFSTDGMHNSIMLRELQQLAFRSQSPADLVSKVDAEMHRRGPEDNYTLIATYALP